MINEGIEYLNSLAQWKGEGGFSLCSIRAVMGHLGNPQDGIKSVHIAGTNGKGSVSAAVAAMLGSAGYKVGLTTSPHLIRVNERIIVDGMPISDEALSYCALTIRDICMRLCIDLTFFEAITAAAFLYFKEAKVDWFVAEVGLGGRLDATNVLSHPEVVAIVSIGYDHEKILGDTLEKIAAEKAGIIKPKSRVFIGRVSPSVLQVIESIAERNDSATFAFGRDFSSEQIDFKLSLCGAHQVSNMALALAVAEDIGVSKDKCRKGLENVFWPCRLEHINSEYGELLIDAAHNPDGIEALVGYLEANNYKNLTVGFGVLDTKNWTRMVDKLKPVIRSWNILKPDFPKALEPQIVADYLSSNGINATIYGVEYDRFLREVCNPSNVTLITGSIYLLGELKKRFAPAWQPIWDRDITY